jgi:hypothetical protein
MEINSEFYKTDLGKRVSFIIQRTSVLLIDRRYELIPADNIKTDLSANWISSMNEMLDNYYVKLLPWRPSEGDGTNIIVETNENFIVDAPFFHEENGKAVEGDIHMIFNFRYDGSTSFDGIHY